MNSIVQHGYGDPERVLRPADTPAPRPGRDEVAVRVITAKVNTPDWIAALGRPYVLRPMIGFGGPRAPIRGSDFAGIVESVGEGVSDLAPGDEVFGSLGTNSFAKGYPGAFRTHTVAPARLVAKKPPELSFDQAACVVMSGLVALQAFRDTVPLRPGHRVLVVGASGGIGTFAVPLAKSMGAEVTGVCSARNADLVRSLGADHVIDYTTTDYTRGAERYDVILDNVMSHSPRASARALAPDGVVIANSVGPNPWWGPLGWLPIVALSGNRRFRTVSHDPSRANLEAIAAALVAGRTRCVIDRAFPFAETGAAVKALASHRARGQIVVHVAPRGSA
jgi:NADPH:quinone reductase-like Zn-dependent oxidoreductase